MAAAAQSKASPPHIPVLLSPVLEHIGGVSGTWIDGTFGAGGYARGLLDAGADKVVGIDRDPDVFVLAADWAGIYGDRLDLRQGTFGQMEELVSGKVDGVVLDLGVSSMQLDQSARGFSFAADGPLDMRMSQDGTSAADIVNGASEQAIADILFYFGEERAARRIAKAIVAARNDAPILTTSQLTTIVESVLPRKKPGQSHPATRSFQALRIAVNDELRELTRGLDAAERLTRPGGHMAVVSFHSLEDRIVKRFFRLGLESGGGSRHAPAREAEPKRWISIRKGITPTAAEVASNPRARSATLRIGTRTDALARSADSLALGLPPLTAHWS